MKIIYFLILLAFLAIACEETGKIPKNFIDSTNASEIQPDHTCWEIEVYFMDSDFTKAALRSDKARVFSSRMETLLDGHVRVEFFSRASGKRLSVLTSDSARIDDRSKDMIARGNVVVVSDSNNTRLETSILFWDNMNQKLYSHAFVKINSPKERLQGYGFESDQNLTNYKIFRFSGELKTQ